VWVNGGCAFMCVVLACRVYAVNTVFVWRLYSCVSVFKSVRCIHVRVVHVCLFRTVCLGFCELPLQRSIEEKQFVC